MTLFPKESTLRVYMRTMDSEDKYAELDHSKASFMPGDIVVTHSEETFHELSGMMLIENRPSITIKEPAKTYSLEKDNSAIVFFTKLPHSVSVKRSKNSVVMTVTM